MGIAFNPFKSGGGPPQSRTLARILPTPDNAERLFKGTAHHVSSPWGEDPIGTGVHESYLAVMNILRMKKVIIAVVGTVAIASLSHSAIFLPNNLSRAKTASPNYESTPAGALDKTNSPSVDSRYRLLGTNGPVWPPNLPFAPKNNTNR